jgi:quercetin dioxygenase-like cupin family protein
MNASQTVHTHTAPTDAAEPARPFVHVPAGRDRHGDDRALIWGLIPLSIKLSARDTNGELFVMQHADMPRGGPPRHVHHRQDEWFYVVKGVFVIEVGGERRTLYPGDTAFAPRAVPHAWACVSDTPGTVITAVSPAGTFEDFIRATTRHAALPPPAEIRAAFEAHDMSVLGPPLAV